MKNTYYFRKVNLISIGESIQVLKGGKALLYFCGYPDPKYLEVPTGINILVSSSYKKSDKLNTFNIQRKNFQILGNFLCKLKQIRSRYKKKEIVFTIRTNK